MGETNGTPRYIWGAPAIAREINQPPKSVYYLLERKLVPARKIGRRWVANRDDLHRCLAAENAA